MKKLLCLFIVLLSAPLHAQEIDRNIVFMQLGLGKVIETGPPCSVNKDFMLERMFFSHERWHIGAHIGFGLWSNGSFYRDLHIKGQNVLLGTSIKHGLCENQRHLLAIDGGYAFFNTQSIGGSAELITGHYHLFTANFSYQYMAKKDFYGRAGIGLFHGLFLGLGIHF